MAKSKREPLSEEHLRLGRLLRKYRKNANVTTREVKGYTTGHISNVENGHVTPSKDLVDLYIRHFQGDRGRILDAFTRMKSGAEQRRRQRRLGGEPSAGTEPVITEDSDLADIRSGYSVPEYEALYRLDGHGVIREVHALRKLRANVRGVSFFGARYSYAADNRPGVMTIHPGAGCSLARCETTNTGSTSAVLRLTRELNPDDEHPHWMAFSLAVHSEVPARPMISYFARSHLARYSIRMLFEVSCRPNKIWWFRGPDSWVVDSKPRAHQFLEHSDMGFYHWDFHNLDAEHAGLAWSWD